MTTEKPLEELFRLHILARAKLTRAKMERSKDYAEFLRTGEQTSRIKRIETDIRIQEIEIEILDIQAEIQMERNNARRDKTQYMLSALIDLCKSEARGELVSKANTSALNRLKQEGRLQVLSA